MEATALSIGKSVLSGALGYVNSAVAEEVALQLGVTRDQAFIRDELEMMLSFLMAIPCLSSGMMLSVWRSNLGGCRPWRIPCILRDRRHVAQQMKDLRDKVEDVSQRSMRYRLIVEGSSSKTATAGDTAAL
ncbi:uncharacterized protein [Miscanthus floridulus]|uniref:uncharacterized protein n=1 Tax=Miscanthus floridulus TaxID=154761 RepID=UPI0034583C63